MDYREALLCKREAEYHLKNELLPFWVGRMKDETNGGNYEYYRSKKRYWNYSSSIKERDMVNVSNKIKISNE